MRKIIWLITLAVICLSSQGRVYALCCQITATQCADTSSAGPCEQLGGTPVPGTFCNTDNGQCEVNPQRISVPTPPWAMALLSLLLASGGYVLRSRTGGITRPPTAG